MKVGDLVELSAKSLRSWPDIRHTYKVGIVVEIEGPEVMPLFTIE